MRQSFITLTICILLASCCKSEETSLTENWEQPHRQMMGLYGPVRNVVETFKVYRFDSWGRLTYYNATGIETGARTRWVGVESVWYEYEYDHAGRLTRATAHELGSPPRTYLLTYGIHDRYVPLLFPLGPYDFFLVKGLERITTSDNSIDYRYDGTQASYSFQSWNGTTAVSYQYEPQKRYPSSRKSVVTRHLLELSRTVMQYTYASDGLLLSTSQLTTIDGEEESKRTVYIARRFLLPQTVVIDGISGTQEWKYTYDGTFRLLGVTLMNNGVDSGEEETYRYSAFDPDGNWTSSLQSWNTLIDWSHPYGTVEIMRDIQYQ